MSEGLGWGLALGAGVLVAFIAYPGRSNARLRPLLMLLRAAAVTIVLALLLDVAIGVARPPEPLVALDVSGSWRRSGDTVSWQAALDSARAAAATGADLLLFGDSVRNATIPAQPGDRASTVTPVMQRAAAAGQRVVIITDGALDDPDAVQQAVAGSRVIALLPRSVADRAVADVSVPGQARAGDTVTLGARIIADGATTSASTLRWTLDAAVLGEAPVPALAAGSEAVVETRVVIPAGDSIAVLRAVIAPGDAQPRNDSIAVAFR
ncbi:MAG TPA: hypothetical protein VE861_01400, partial [Gemmatimonadaceae bacterium]|nr:hypothetical protein [Gemmatimonadaceae bacterium]